jgi:hypothetical protein
MALRRNFHENVAVGIRHVQEIPAYDRAVLGSALRNDQFRGFRRHYDFCGAELCRRSCLARVGLRSLQCVLVLDQIADVRRGFVGWRPSPAQQVGGCEPHARPEKPILFALRIEDHRQSGVDHLLQTAGSRVLKPWLAIEQQQDRWIIHHDHFRRIIAVIGVRASIGGQETSPQARQRNRKIPLRNVGFQKLDQ